MSDSSPSILLVDDDPVFLDVLGKALQRRGYTTLSARNLGEAMALAKANPPGYAVIDLKIDKESGLDCISGLKALNPDIRMLVLTGYSSIATAVSAIKLGAHDYACKPLDADEILTVLTADPQQRPAEPVSEQPISVDRLEWEHIQRVLDANQGNISATARSLGMHRRTLQRKLQKRPVRR